MTNPNPNVYESIGISPDLLKNIDFKHVFLIRFKSTFDSFFLWIYYGDTAVKFKKSVLVTQHSFTFTVVNIMFEVYQPSLL